VVLLGRSYCEGCYVLCFVIVDIPFVVVCRIRACFTGIDGGIFVLYRVVGGERCDGVCECGISEDSGLELVGVLRINRSE
jgi:hypothetical protein